MKHTIPYSIVLLFLVYAQQSLSMDAPPAPQVLADESKEAGQPLPVIGENQPQPTQLYPPILDQPPLQDPNAGQPQQQEPIQPVPPVPVPESFYTRVHGSVDKWTGFVDTIVTTRFVDLPIAHTAYTKFPVTTKLILLGLAGFVISRTQIFKNGVNKVKETINKLIGNSSDIDDDDDDDEDDEEVNKPVYNSKLLMQKL